MNWLKWGLILSAWTAIAIGLGIGYGKLVKASENAMKRDPVIDKPQ